MADASSQINDLSCSVCCDIFKDPVLLSCSHSFCKGCLQSWWTQNQEQNCPLCKRRSSRTEPPRNIALKNLSEAFQRENVDLCPLHGEKLKLFCRDDLETACLICRHSEKHANHRFLPVDEAAKIHREEIKKLLKPQKEKLEVFVETNIIREDMAADINVQTAHTERQIQNEFKKLHQFLQDEEKSRITALRGEEQLKGQKMKKEIEERSKQIETISHTVTETEQQLVAGDISFLKKFKATREKIAQPPPLKALPEETQLDVDKHLGNLAYAVWKKLEENVSSFPVILDPNTAGPDHHLSEDLTSLRRGARQQLPENKQRQYGQYGVLGTRSLEPTPGMEAWLDSQHLPENPWRSKFGEMGSRSAKSRSDRGYYQSEPRLTQVRGGHTAPTSGFRIKMRDRLAAADIAMERNIAMVNNRGTSLIRRPPAPSPPSPLPRRRSCGRRVMQDHVIL